MNTPTVLLHAVFEAMNLEDWKALGDLCDPVGLRLFKKNLLEEATAADFIDLDEVDDGASGYRRPTDPAEYLKSELYDVSTLEEFKAMDPAKVFARWVQGKNQRQYRFRREAMEDWKREETMKLSHSFSFVVLGSLLDTDGIAYVMYRNDRDVPPAPVNRKRADDDDSEAPDENELNRILCVRSFVEAAICRKQDDGSWKLVPTHSLYLVPTFEVVDFG